VTITPYLLYEDAGAAIGWLKKAFGTRAIGRPMKDGDGIVRHAGLALGEDALMLGGPAAGYRNPKSSGGATVLVHIDVADVQKVFDRAVKAGAKVIESPQPTPYGALRCALEDPEGHQWWFAQPLPKPAKKKAKKRTSTARRK
jgi:PhnB protein